MEVEVPLSIRQRVAFLLRPIVILLAAQFVVGIWVDLFGSIRDSNSLAAAIGFLGVPVLTPPYAPTMILGLLGAALMALAHRHRFRQAPRATLRAGFLAVLWASGSGIEFVRSGFSFNEDSFSMAPAFIVSSPCYGRSKALVLAASGPTSPSPSERHGPRVMGQGAVAEPRDPMSPHLAEVKAIHLESMRPLTDHPSS